MIQDWRKKWKADYPFIFAQLPNYDGQNNRWITLRESQAKALSLPNIGMAVLIDAGEDDNIHPIHKQIVGKRMGIIASNIAYGEKNVPISAPVFESFTVEGNAILVHFTNGTFTATTNKEMITGFTIAGNDKKFYTAKATLMADRKTIKVTCPEVQKPSAVRYLWADAPGKVMLYNTEGLVTPPFRSDSW